MQELAKGIQPAWLRGAESNYITFVINTTDIDQFSMCQAHPLELIMTPTQWDNLNTFAKRVSWKVLFDLNIQLRNGTTWNASNAIYPFKLHFNKGLYTKQFGA